MFKRTITILFILALFFTTSANASVTEGGVAILYGDGHAFTVKAPEGWVLDTDSGVDAQIYATFYPKGERWKDSEVIAYARGVPKNAAIPDISSFVTATIKEYHRNGSTGYKGHLVSEVQLKKDRIAKIYHYEGDSFGNYEAVAYIEEEKTINFIVYTSRSKEAFEASIQKFHDIVDSYFFITDQVDMEKIEDEKQ